MNSTSSNILRYALTFLIVVSIGVLTWQHFGMERNLRIDANSAHQFIAVDDRTQGGKSVAHLSKVNDAMVMKCKIAKSEYQWPYCQIRIQLTKMPSGMDLSHFDDIDFNLSRSGPGPEKVRVYLNNFEAYSKINDSSTLKVNELLLDTKGADMASSHIPLNLFRVASWWVEYKNIPLIDTDMQVDNVPIIEISTPGFAPEGEHVITLKYIEFHGKWLSLTQVLLGIVSAWLTFGVAWLGFEIFQYRQRLSQERSLRSELEVINRVLEIQAEVLSNQAQIDPLTGALNRAGLNNLLSKKWPGEIPKDAQLSILFADLDHFKRINDTHGHAVGDEVLQQFAQLVKNKIRKSDGFIRWGGKEFLVACPEMPHDLAVKLAENIRDSAAKTSWPHSMAVTCSCGVATRKHGEDFNELIERADIALYRAKKSGRNRVEVG
nr:GGDEF domain-containing protein [uncultured Deefgea sp.]